MSGRSARPCFNAATAATAAVMYNSDDPSSSTIGDWKLGFETAGLSEECRSCLDRLSRHRSQELPALGNIRRAAVLVALFQLPGSQRLSVLLTTRSRNLRRHPSATALPGGKCDDTDPDVVFTARREAFEEVGLPMGSHPNIHFVTTLDPVATVLPHNAQIAHIIVVPVVVFISDPAILSTLVANPDEVEYIFTHPLLALLSEKPPEDTLPPLALSAQGHEWWPFEEEYHSMQDRTGQSTGNYRMHRFRTTHSPIKGLTADVLINTARLAFGRAPPFARYADNQEPFAVAIPNIVRRFSRVSEDDAVEVDERPSHCTLQIV